MPRKSDRRRAIEWMEKKVSSLNKDAIQREVLSDHDSIQDEEDEHMRLILKQMKLARYIFRAKKYRNRKKLTLKNVFVFIAELTMMKSFCSIFV